MKIFNGLAQAFVPKNAYRPIIEAGMKAGVMASREDAPKQTGRMAGSTDYVMKSDTLAEAFVSVGYGLFQDQGTRFIRPTYFFSKNMEAAFLAIQKMVDEYHTWLIRNNFDMSKWRPPQGINLSGTVSGVSRTQTTSRTITKTIRSRRPRRRRR